LQDQENINFIKKGDLPSLESLTISYYFDNSLEPLKHLKSLKELIFDNNCENIEVLQYCESLESLVFKWFNQNIFYIYLFYFHLKIYH
jgi:hypothetical protein